LFDLICQITEVNAEVIRYSILSGYETMNMIRKGQVKGVEKGDILAQVRLIERLFGLAA